MSTNRQFTTDREIIYCAETKDYALYLDGALVGFARSYHEGEEVLNALVYESLLASPLSEVEALAQEIASTQNCSLSDALEIARAKLDQVMNYAREWDAWVESFAKQSAA